MNVTLIRVVAQREAREVLADWRMLVPLTVMTIGLPLLIVAGMLYLSSSFHDQRLVARLVPLGVLICGFLPAGFSLMSASESFVGEKERHTLESLLATPMSDTELFLGKLAAALMTPIISSLLAIAMFSSIFLLLAPTFAMLALSPGLVGLVIAMVLLKTIAMVAIAVVISIHATTVRAANLLASFVLLTMGVVVQIEGIQIAAGHIEVMLSIGAVLLIVGVLLIRVGLLSFDRERILARDHAGLNISRTVRMLRRFLTDYKPLGSPLESYDTTFSLRRFYRREFPALLVDYRLPLLCAGLAMFTGLLAGALAFANTGTWTSASSVMTAASQSPGAGLAVRVFATNVGTTCVATLLSPATLGILALLSMVVTGAQVGYQVMRLAAGETSSSRLIVIYLLPQLLMHLPAAVLSGGLSLHMGLALLRRSDNFPTGLYLLRSFASFLKVLVLVLVPLFGLVALVEGWFVPLMLR